MLVYVASPYSSVPDKHQLMRTVAQTCGKYMLAYPGQYAVSGLIHHYALSEVEGLGTDYEFWKNWCETFLRKCEKLVVLTIPGWNTSTGVAAEIQLAKSLNMPIEFIDPTSFYNIA